MPCYDVSLTALQLKVKKEKKKKKKKTTE